MGKRRENPIFIAIRRKVSDGPVQIERAECTTERTLVAQAKRNHRSFEYSTVPGGVGGLEESGRDEWDACFRA